jgi:O-antigen/teichoic acid export membrane protein
MSFINVSSKVGVRSLGHNVGFLVFSRISEKVLGFFYLFVLARFLGPHMLGMYNYGLAWYLIFLPLACWALDNLLSIHLGRRPDNAEEVVGAMIVIRVIATILAAVFSLVFGLLSNNDAISRTVIVIFATALVGRSIAMWGRNCFVAVELSQYSAGLEIGLRIVEVFFGIVYLWFGGGIIGLCIIHSGCWLAEGVVALALVRSRLSLRKLFVNWNLVRTFAIQAFPVVVNVFFKIALCQSGFIVLKHLSTDPSVLGFYAVAFQLVINTSLIPEAIGNAALPILSRAHSRGTGEQIVFLEAMLKIYSFFSAVLAMFLIVYGSVVIRLFFGVDYLAASGALLICSIAMVAYYPLLVANDVLKAGLEYVPAAVNIGIALAANIVVSVFLVTEMREQAPAIGLVVGASSTLMLHLIVIHRKIGKISWWCAVIKPMLFVLIALIATWNLRQLGGYGFGAGLIIISTCFAAWRIFTPVEMGYFAKLLPSLRRPQKGQV